MNTRSLKVFDEGEVAKVLDTAYRIAEEIGFSIKHQECRKLLLDAGCRADGDIIYLPREVAQRCVSYCPSEVVLYDQLGAGFVLGVDGHFHFSGSDMIQVLDYETGRVRRSTYEDVVRFTILADALPNIDGISPHVYATDLPEPLIEPATYYATLAHTTKHCLAAPLSPSRAEMWIEMCRRVSPQHNGQVQWAGSIVVAGAPPLRFEPASLGALLQAARARMPIFPLGGGLAGASAPITMAGCAAIKTAEGLLLLCLAQLAQPGCPIVWSTGGQPIMDMRVADMAEGGPEDCLGSIASAQVAQALGIPSYTCSFHTDAKRPDVQVGAEKMAGILASMLGGQCCTINAGAVAKCAVASYEQMVIDDEILAFARRLAAGIAVNDDTLAFDVIREVGHGGSFLGHPHTVQYLRGGENLYLEVFDRTNPKSDYEDILDRAHKKAQALIAAHKPATPPEHVAALGAYYRLITGQEAPAVR